MRAGARSALVATACVVGTLIAPVRTSAGPSTDPVLPTRNGHIVFSVTAAPFDQAPDEYHEHAVMSGRDLFTVAPRGTAIRQVTDSPTYADYDPAWSPDGAHIAFTRADLTFGRTLGTDLYVIEADGSNPRPLTSTLECLEVQPSWSPDGKRILFSTDCAMPDFVWRVGNRGGETDLWVMDADGSNLRPLTSDPGSEDAPDWSSTGWIAFRDGTSLAIMRADGSGRRILMADAIHPQWSPDGKRIVFTTFARTTIWVVNADGSGRRDVSPTGGGTFVSPTWSPDGKQMSFISNRDGSWKLYKMQADGSNVRKLVDIDLRAPFGSPDWGPRP